jgi:hypothetical protein
MDEELLLALLIPRPLTVQNFLSFWSLVRGIPDVMDKYEELLRLVRRYIETVEIPISFCIHCDDLADHPSESCMLPAAAGLRGMIK